MYHLASQLFSQHDKDPFKSFKSMELLSLNLSQHKGAKSAQEFTLKNAKLKCVVTFETHQTNTQLANVPYDAMSQNGY